MRGNRKPDSKTVSRRLATRELEALAARTPRRTGGHPTFASRQRASRRQQRHTGIRASKRIVPRETKSVSGGWNSPREMARRLAQIERGQLREENGLVR